MTKNTVDKRIEMINGLGFNQDMVDSAINRLNKKEDIELLRKISTSLYYQVLASDKQFTIYSDSFVRNYDIARISEILGRKYINCGTLIDDNGLWQNWVDLG